MNIDKRLLNCEIGGLDWCFITTEYRTRVHCIHMYHPVCNALVHVIYSVVSGQYSYTTQYYTYDLSHNYVFNLPLYFVA